MNAKLQSCKSCVMLHLENCRLIDLNVTAHVFRDRSVKDI